MKIIELFKHPESFWVWLGRNCGIVPDELYLKSYYKKVFGVELDLSNPQSFSEKLQWLKLYDRNPRYIDYVDKAKVKEIIGNLLGIEYVVPTLGIWSKFDEIDFDKLPSKFVLKCTHDSGGVVICTKKDEFDVALARRKINSSLKQNYFYRGREWPYKNVVPKIIAEEYLECEDGDLRDYKLMCFNGVVKCTFVCSDRFSQNGLNVTFFDNNWNRLPFGRKGHAQSKEVIERPLCLEQMIRFAEIIAKDIPFLRVDFYEIRGRLYFGEATFYPASGLEQFEPNEYDLILGSMLDLPAKARM